MVGDDRVHLVDPDDLTKIEDDDYCHECGQVGCRTFIVGRVEYAVIERPNGVQGTARVRDLTVIP